METFIVKISYVYGEVRYIMRWLCWEVFYMGRFVVLGDFRFNGALLYRRFFLYGEVIYLERFLILEDSLYRKFIIRRRSFRPTGRFPRLDVGMVGGGGGL